jgi:mRNA degradation ribonuclease J1/J2
MGETADGEASDPRAGPSLVEELSGGRIVLDSFMNVLKYFQNLLAIAMKYGRSICVVLHKNTFFKIVSFIL